MREFNGRLILGMAVGYVLPEETLEREGHMLFLSDPEGIVVKFKHFEGVSRYAN